MLGLALAAVAALFALWILAQPLPGSSTDAADSGPDARTAASGTVSTPTLTPTPRPTVPPTHTDTPPPTPTSPPTVTPTPTDTPTPTPTPTPVCTETAGRVEQHTYFSQTTGDEQPYRVYLPPCYDHTDTRYPVLYLFHGWPYDDAHWIGLGVVEPADAGISTNTLPPFIVVLPGGAERLYVNTSGGDHSFEGEVVNDLIPHVDSTYRTRAEPDARAVGGISRGGVWALEIGFLHADLFAAVGAHSPALSVNLAPPLYDPFYLLTAPGVETLRIYLDAGEQDWARESTEALHRALDQQGIVHQFVVHPGRHENALWAANVAEYLAFYAAAWPTDDALP